MSLERNALHSMYNKRLGDYEEEGSINSNLIVSIAAAELTMLAE